MYLLIDGLVRLVDMWSKKLTADTELKKYQNGTN